MKNKPIKYILLSVAITSSLLFTACGHEHQFSDATCTTPKTCNECGEIEGEALGHNWLEATCENPKTCDVCNATEGEPLGHNWLEATTEAPQTCELCGLTEGEALPTEAESEPDLTFNVDILEMTAKGYKEDLEAGRIDQETYDVLMGFLAEAEELADENGDFSLNEVYAETDKEFNQSNSSSSSSQNYEYNPNSYSAQHGTTKKSGEGDVQGIQSLDGYYDPALAGIRSN